MAAPRREVELAIKADELAQLQMIARSRKAAASRVERARMLLAYRDTPSFYAVGRAMGVTHQTVERCLGRALRLGVLAALDDSPRPGREPVITSEAKAWLVDLACRKPTALNYPHELWTTRLLAQHVRAHGPTAGHACLAKLAQGTVCKLLAACEIKPHKVRYYLERRDPAFEQKKAEVLCVYREVEVRREAASGDDKLLAVISYDEKPGIQALGTTTPDLPPRPGEHACLARDHEYVRHGTLSLLAGIDLLTGKVHARVEKRHRSVEFIAFLEQLDQAYPAETAIRMILDNHSAHISKTTRAWLATQPDGRFSFVFTPKHGSWLNLIEGFFSKLARSALRHIRVASQQGLKDRIMAAINDVNRDPVIHRWTYGIEEATNPI
jgi:transposase